MLTQADAGHKMECLEAMMTAETFHPPVLVDHRFDAALPLPGKLAVELQRRNVRMLGRQYRQLYRISRRDPARPHATMRKHEQLLRAMGMCTALMPLDRADRSQTISALEQRLEDCLEDCPTSIDAPLMCDQPGTAYPTTEPPDGDVSHRYDASLPLTAKVRREMLVRGLAPSGLARLAGSAPRPVFTLLGSNTNPRPDHSPPITVRIHEEEIRSIGMQTVIIPVIGDELRETIRELRFQLAERVDIDARLVCSELEDPTAALLAEIADRKSKRLDVAKTYAIARRSRARTRWRAVDRAIVGRWSEATLAWIQDRADFPFDPASVML